MHRFRALLAYCVVQVHPSSAFLPGSGGRRLLGRAASSFQPSICTRTRPSRSTTRSVSGRTTALRGRFVEPPPSDDSVAESWGEDSGNTWDDSGSQHRWEKVWQEGEKEKQKSSFLSNMADWDAGKSGGPEVEYAMPVEVVSFDLDDTLWSTKGVIEAANAALQDHMSREHPALAEKFVISDLMKDVWKERLAEDPKLDAAPVNLTELRKAGLARACELSETDPSTVVESCFEVWRRARHDVEPFLFPGVLETLKALREREVRLVAITNGNAQTEDIPCLKDLFEFCVMAEQVGERKPQSGPFREAVRRAGYPSEDHVGGEWVHVGDDWATDCVGAKGMRMRAVLVRVPGKPAAGEVVPVNDDDNMDATPKVDDEENEYPVLEDDGLSEKGLIGAAWRVSEEKEKAKRRAERLGLTMVDDFEVIAGTATINRDTPSAESETPSEETAKTATEAVKKGEKGGAKPDAPEGPTYGAEMSAIAMGDYSSIQGPGKVMSMGSASYVTDMIMNDFMDVKLESIFEVVGLVDQWNEKYSETAALRRGFEDLLVDNGGTVAQQATSAAAAAKQESTAAVAGGTGGGVARDSKFCIGCGAKIPGLAKFCPECGTKQETV